MGIINPGTQVDYNANEEDSDFEEDQEDPDTAQKAELGFMLGSRERIEINSDDEEPGLFDDLLLKKPAKEPKTAKAKEPTP